MRLTWQRLRDGVNVLLRRRRADAELDAEVQHYYEEHVASLQSAGVSRAEAQRRARLELGEQLNVRADVRAAGWEHVLASATGDVRYALRRMRNNLAATTVCVLTLALGIGASTAIFSAVKPILLEPLPYPEAKRLITIWDRMTDGTPLEVTFGTHRELLLRSRSLADMAVLRAWQPTLTGVDDPQRVEGQRVSASYFRVLGVAPVVGEDFAASDDVVGGRRVVMLSHRIWQRDFGGDNNIVGRIITLSDQPYTVVGVMPPTFENVLAASADVWAPLQYDATLPPDGREWGHHLRLVARVRRDVTLEQARRDIAAIAAVPVAEFTRVPWASLQAGLTVQSLHGDVTRAVRPALLAVSGAVLLLLAIAALNVTNLLLAQAARRRSEIALRTALGAARSRLVAQHVIESLLLACLGAAAGMLVAYAGIRSLVAVAPEALPRVAAIGFDGAVFVFALGVTTVTGLIIGVMASLHWTRRERASTAAHHSTRVASRDSAVRRTLVVAEVALAVVLLVSGGLLLRSLQTLLTVDTGFDDSGVLTMQLRASQTRFDTDEAVRQYFGELLDAVRAVPGIETAALADQLPLTGDYLKFGATYASSNVVIDPDADGSVLRYAVTPDYFEAMGIALRNGRLLTATDVAGAPRAALVSESLARRTFPGGDPIGEQMRIGGDPDWWTIVGVVADVKQQSLASPDENAVYVAAAQTAGADRTVRLVVRTRTDAAALAPAVRNAVWAVQRDQPISDVATMTDLVARSSAERRFILIIFEAFALAALLLAAIGLYGLLAGGVHERLREIGVRAALGATRAQIVTLVMRQALTLTAVGLMIGLTSAFGVTRTLESLLFGTSPTDTATYAGVTLLLALVAAAAASIPAWRAMRIDPAVTLRAP